MDWIAIVITILIGWHEANRTLELILYRPERKKITKKK